MLRNRALRALASHPQRSELLYSHRHTGRLRRQEFKTLTYFSDPSCARSGVWLCLCFVKASKTKPQEPSRPRPSLFVICPRVTRWYPESPSFCSDQGLGILACSSFLGYASQNILDCVGKGSKANYDKEVGQCASQESVVAVGLL